jgi:hypothetical protein
MRVNFTRKRAIFTRLRIDFFSIRVCDGFACQFDTLHTTYFKLLVLCLVQTVCSSLSVLFTAWTHDRHLQIRMWYFALGGTCRLVTDCCHNR